jgi:hypothetical protein
MIPSECRLDARGRPICVLGSCNKPLRKAARSAFWRYGESVQPYGWLGNGMFCSERCAATWGVNKAYSGSDE